MANDITKFTNLENWFNRVKDDQYFKLSEQRIKGLTGWTPEEKQILENMKTRMSDEDFRKIKDINKFNFSEYVDTTPKPAANGTVPETKPEMSKLPSAEDVGIKQAGKLKSILNGINPFYGFTEAATRQGMYDKAVADAKRQVIKMEKFQQT